MTIPELVSELRDAFRPNDFDRVEQVLVARESRLNAEIEERKREIRRLETEIEIQRLGRISAELQLERFKETAVMQERCELEGEKCGHFLELERKWKDEKDAADDLRIRTSTLECEKMGLLEERKKWIDERGAIAELREENRRLLEENRRLLRVESCTMNEKLVVDGGDGHCGENTGKKKTVVIDVHEFEPMKKNEDVGLSSRKSPILPSKDGLCVSARGRLGMTPIINIVDSDEDECNSRGTLPRKETTSKIMADNELPISSGAVQPKQLPVASSREVGKNFNILDGLASDTSSCGSSSSGSLDMDSLPLSTVTSRKRMRTEPVLD